MLKKIILLIVFSFSISALFAQTALKILKTDGSITYINTSAVDTISFVSTLAIGTTYQGGIIFYLDANGEHGLIAAPDDQSDGIQWYNGIYTRTNAIGDSIGAGMGNTELIIADQGSGPYAAYLCDTLTVGGNTDWYLPSETELHLLFTNLKENGLGNFSSSYYWSSTEHLDINYALGAYFGFDYESLFNKNSINFHVRAVRAF